MLTELATEQRTEIRLNRLKLSRLKEFLESDESKELSKDLRDCLKKQEKELESYIETCSNTNNSIESLMGIIISKGDSLIGNFNASDNPSVSDIKLKAISLVDTIERVGIDPRRKAVSYTQIELGVMAGVKSIFS